MRIAAIGAAALVAVSLAGCGDDDDGAVAGDAPTTSSTIEVAEGLRDFPTDVAPLPRAGEEPADGEHAVEISAVDADAGTMTVDFLEFLTGDAANQAVQEENPGMDGAPDDYYVRDTEDVDVTLDVADDVRVTVVELGNGPVANVPATFADVNADGDPSPYWWITIDGGTVVEINQQYVP
jgi:hypothetical protein